MKLKLPTHFHVPHLNLVMSRKKVGRWMMRYGSYCMLVDGVIKLGIVFLGLEFLHHWEAYTSVAGSNGAFVAGWGALMDIAEDA